MSPTPLLGRATRFAGAAAVTGAVFALSHWDRLTMYGDDVNKLSPGRALPLPEAGNYIGSRVVDNYFIGYLFEVFRALAGPLLGLEHLVDAHAAYATALYAVTGVAVVGALFALASLATPLRPRHFPVFALAAYVLALAPTKMPTVTGIGSFQLPLALSLWLLYPVLRYTILGTDALARWRPAGAAAAMAALAYLVAFSVTSVALFTVGVVASCAAYSWVRGSGNPLARMAGWPRWHRLLAFGLPALVALATYYDVTSGRFADEREQQFRVVGFETLSWLRGMSHLPLRQDGALGVVVALALLAAAGGAVRAWLRSPAEATERALALCAALLPTFVAYSFFLLRISNLGGKDYFAHPGISAYFPFAACVAALAALFGMARSSATLPAVLGTLGLGLLAVHGGRQLAEVPQREASKAEVKALFDAMAFCHAYGEREVPVLLPHAPLGWPYGATEEGWYMDAYRRAFREHVAGYGAYVDPEWKPVFYRVYSLAEWHGALGRIAETRLLRDVAYPASPYAIRVPGVTDLAATPSEVFEQSR